MNNKKFKIKDELVMYGLIRIFEEESIMVKILKEIVKFMKKIIIFAFIYFIIILILQKYVILTLLLVSLTSIWTLEYVTKEFGKIYYKYSKGYGGKKFRYFQKNTQEIIMEDRRTIEIEDLRIFKEMLKVNKLDKKEKLKELREELLNEYNPKTQEREHFMKEIVSVLLFQQL